MSVPLFKMLRELADDLEARSRRHECPGIHCSICVPAAIIERLRTLSTSTDDLPYTVEVPVRNSPEPLWNAIARTLYEDDARLIADNRVLRSEKRVKVTRLNAKGERELLCDVVQPPPRGRFQR